MKLFLTGEGPTDCGKKDLDGLWLDGPIQSYIRKIIPGIEILTVERKDVRDMRHTKRQQRRSKQLAGHAERAFYVGLAAIEHKCDAVAMYVDADKGQGRAPKDLHGCEKRYEEIKQQILDGLSLNPIAGRMAIVPMHMIESWLLGSKSAFSVLYPQTNFDDSFFRTPELTWGDEKDPKSEHPKRKLQRALELCGRKRCRDEYIKIAEVSNIKELCKLCPISFNDFYMQCIQLLDCCQHRKVSSSMSAKNVGNRDRDNGDCK